MAWWAKIPEVGIPVFGSAMIISRKRSWPDPFLGVGPSSNGLRAVILTGGVSVFSKVGISNVMSATRVVAVEG